MASQFGVAYSASVAGVGMVAGGPYGCSRGSVSTAMLNCSCPADKPQLFEVTRYFGLDCRALGPDQYLAFADGAVARNKGQIDDVANLRRQRIWIYRGDKDGVVNGHLTEAARDLYLGLGVPKEQIDYVDMRNAGHAFPSPQSSDQCDLTRFPFMVKCPTDAGAYDAAGSLLKWLYTDLGDKQALAPQPAQLRQFKQAGYAGKVEFSGLDDTAWVYIPQACEKDGSKCRLHVAFHGCEQGQSFRNGNEVFGKRFVQGAGYNEWAEAANVVVLYPQAKSSTLGNLANPYRYNPKGCWDFWGYTEKYAPMDRNFSKQSAPQMKAVKAMIDTLLSPAAQ
ncbi:hypothetical protein HHL10_12850 [Azohydromonas sp. G-1-1-14]|uniref:Poly(3-hydroxybutyrate) depolymerase n=1 Tax=Azohydromonas caseinilytica TaxID=2728836 RepID=A0A848F940_9BURK|nr:hypothetical protein [Azohydromonas caseinilytica]NML15862.1 hypothetical protein [Azohydromonas caseinilytica]